MDEQEKYGIDNKINDLKILRENYRELIAENTDLKEKVQEYEQRIDALRTKGEAEPAQPAEKEPIVFSGGCARSDFVDWVVANYPYTPFGNMNKFMKYWVGDDEVEFDFGDFTAEIIKEPEDSEFLNRIEVRVK
jgi:hypothetical protein